MKIPVGKTLEAAFTFVFKNFLSILGIFWFPMLVAVILVGGVLLRILVGVHHFPDPKADMQTFMRLMIELGALYVWAIVVFIVTGAMIQVGLLRKALGLHPSPVFIFYSLDGDVWRMIGAMLLLIVVSIGLLLGFVIVDGLIYWLTGVAAGQSVATGITVIAGIVTFCFYIYAMVRLGYFLPAVVVAEHHIGFSRAWELARGNFWRIVALVLVMALAVGIVASMVQSIFAPPFIMNFGPNNDPNEFLRAYMTYLHSAGPAIAIVSVLQTFFLYGLMAGATANAYRAVTQPPLPQGTLPA